MDRANDQSINCWCSSVSTVTEYTFHKSTPKYHLGGKCNNKSLKAADNKGSHDLFAPLCSLARDMLFVQKKARKESILSHQAGRTIYMGNHMTWTPCFSKQELLMLSTVTLLNCLKSCSQKVTNFKGCFLPVNR